MNPPVKKYNILTLQLEYSTLRPGYTALNGQGILVLQNGIHARVRTWQSTLVFSCVMGYIIKQLGKLQPSEHPNQQIKPL